MPASTPGSSSTGPNNTQGVPTGPTNQRGLPAKRGATGGRGQFVRGGPAGRGHFSGRGGASAIHGIYLYFLHLIILIIQIRLC